MQARELDAKLMEGGRELSRNLTRTVPYLAACNAIIVLGLFRVTARKTPLTCAANSFRGRVTPQSLERTSALMVSPHVVPYIDNANLK